MKARLLVVALLTGLAGLTSWLSPYLSRPPDPFQSGLQLLAQGRARDAVYLMNGPEWQGVAHFRAGQYLRAAEAFSQVGSIQAQYNVGNSYANVHRWDAAIMAFEEVLRRDPTHFDARHNLEVVERAQALEKELILAERQASEIKRGQAKGDDGDADMDASGTPPKDTPPENLAAAASAMPGQTIDNAPEGLLGERRQNQGEVTGTSEAQDTAGDAIKEPSDNTPAAYAASGATSTLSAVVFLDRIIDDPARVLSSRLRIAHQLRQRARDQ